MPTLTRAQLRDGVNPPANLTAGNYDFTLTNTAHNIYFSIEGQDALIFNSASITSPVGCSFTSGLKNAATSITSGSTSTFTLSVTTDIPKEDIKFRATNILVYNQATPVTASIFGVEADYS